MVVIGAATYSTALIPAAGRRPAVNGSYFDQNASLYLGGDASSIPAVRRSSTGSTWRRPGSTPTSSPSTGGLSAQLFVQALKNAGQDPSRGSILQALSQDHLVQRWLHRDHQRPGGRTTSNCYLVGKVAERRVDPRRTIRRSTAHPRLPVRLLVRDAAAPERGRAVAGLY